MSNKGRTPHGDELSLWRWMTNGIRAWRDDAMTTPVTASPPPPPLKSKNKSAPFIAKQEKPSTPTFSESGRQLDRRTADKLTKGKMPIEATLDLHGLTQGEAHSMLNSFITGSYATGKRCVLVITGKGSGATHDGGIVSERREKGVLRARLPEWLAQPPLDYIVLRHVRSHGKHGGSGAFYIYLRNRLKEN